MPRDFDEQYVTGAEEAERIASGMHHDIGKPVNGVPSEGSGADRAPRDEVFRNLAQLRKLRGEK